MPPYAIRVYCNTDWRKKSLLILVLIWFSLNVKNPGRKPHAQVLFDAFPVITPAGNDLDPLPALDGAPAAEALCGAKCLSREILSALP